MKVVNYLMQTESKHHIPNILSVYIPNILSGNESHMKTLHSKHSDRCRFDTLLGTKTESMFYSKYSDSCRLILF